MTEWRSSRLDGGHLLDSFASGRVSIDRWLREHARRADAAGTARTYVWTGRDDVEVVAFFSIAPTQVLRDEPPVRRLSGGSTVVPAYLIGRLALDASLHGRGLGTEILLDALGRIVDVADRSGGRLVVVDASDEQARAFYLRHDFIGIAGSDRLYLKVATARAALGG